MKRTNNSVKYAILFKQYLPAFLDISENIETLMVPCKSTAEEVSLEWSHHGNSFDNISFPTFFCHRNVQLKGN